MQVTQGGSSVLTRHYLGGQYELDETVGGTKEKLYLSGDAYSAPAVYVRSDGGAWQVYYIYRDYQGSITHITNSSGTLVQELSYDAWGRLRNPDTQVAYAPGAEPALFLGRGYTGHEHLQQFGLINMNARLYDPALGRFLSPDPYVQSPDFTQNYNRYSYCLNNPLKYTDENGEFIFTLICVFVPGMQAFLPYAVAADISWMSEYGSQVANNFTMARQNGNDYSPKDIFLGEIDWFDVGISAVSGGVSAVPGLGWVSYATPAVTNAVNIKGNGSVETIFGGNDKGGKIEFGRYLGNTFLETGAVGATDLLKCTLGKNSTKDIVNNLPKNTLKNMPKKELWEMSSKQLFGNLKYDGWGAYFGKLSQEGFNMEYNNMIGNQNSTTPYNTNPFIPNNPESPNRIKKNASNINSVDIIINNLSLTKR